MDEDAARLAAWRALLGTHAALVRDLDRRLSVEHGLSLSDFDVLHHLANEPERRLRLGELSSRLLFSRAGVTGLVRRLEQAGLVARESVAEDGRGVVAVLTPDGERRFRAAKTTQLSFVQDSFAPTLTGRDLVTLHRLLASTRP